ncbi:MAG: hypothetical protein M3404_01830 [Actinomycetota bacterium]|nr:hypothetical protein [Actinomycetota bacterium]
MNEIRAYCSSYGEPCDCQPPCANCGGELRDYPTLAGHWPAECGVCGRCRMAEARAEMTGGRA